MGESLIILRDGIGEGFCIRRQKEMSGVSGVTISATGEVRSESNDLIYKPVEVPPATSLPVEVFRAKPFGTF